MKKNSQSKNMQDIILLEDLAPLADIKGGKNYLLFGERILKKNNIQSTLEEEEASISNGGNHEDKI